jgi:2-dehydro-3-deoxy-D-arabinonate dehydratase
MKLARYRDLANAIQVGVVFGGRAYDLPVPSLGELLQHTVEEIRTFIDDAWRSGRSHRLSEIQLVRPIDDRTEIWGAGVTYHRSRTARASESRFEQVYLDVYDAERPELFFKSVAWRVLTDGDHAGLRDDSSDLVPEPELAIVLNRHAEIVGAAIVNDLTARDIEAENPIYLPQAKMFRGSCVLSSLITPWWEIIAPEDLGIALTIIRDGAEFFSGNSRTSTMRRNYDELISWLFRAEQFPDGVILSTGTGIVPDLGNTLRAGDTVTVTIDQVGTLTNVMTHEPTQFQHLVSSSARPASIPFTTLPSE